MQLVPLGFNGPRFQKVFYNKRLTQITKLTSKNVINELSEHHRWSRGHKAQGQGQEHKKTQGQGQEQLFREQTLSKPKTGMLEAKAKDQEHRRQMFYEKNKVFKIFFRQSKNKKNKVFNHIFQPIARKNGL